MISASSTVASSPDKFRLLKIDGSYVKWGPPQFGRGAAVTYSFVSGRMDVPSARNCRSMDRLEELSKKSETSKAILREEFAAAARAWEAVSDIRLTYVEDARQADILIGSQTVPRGRAFANVSYERGQTAPGTGLTEMDGSIMVGGVQVKLRRMSKINMALICLNPVVRWKVGFDGDLDRYDLRYTFMHEIGHAIGLNHPGPSGNIMSFRYGEGSRKLSNGDIQGARLLYGPARADGQKSAQVAD